MKGITRIRYRQPWTRRFLFPSLTILAVWALMEIAHAQAWKLGIPLITLLAAWTCGLGGFLLLFLSPLLMYPLAYSRNASLMERSLTALTPFLAECGFQTFIASQIYTTGEALYYSLGPIFLVVLFANLSVMGVCEILCRLRIKSRHIIRVWTAGPFIAILCGPVAVWVMLVWDGGVHWFYLYQEGYKFLFL